MRRIAATVLEQETALPDLYWRDAGHWKHIGYLVAAMLVVYFLLVFKPVRAAKRSLPPLPCAPQPPNSAAMASGFDGK